MGFLRAAVIVIAITLVILAPACDRKQIEWTVMPMPALTKEKLFDNPLPRAEVSDAFLPRARRP